MMPIPTHDVPPEPEKERDKSPFPSPVPKPIDFQDYEQVEEDILDHKEEEGE